MLPVLPMLAGLLVAAAPAWAQDQAAATAQPRFEGAVGLILKRGPAFLGSSDQSTGATPAGFVRWGRFTASGAGGFTTKRAEDVARGLGAELVRRDDLRLTLALRYDQGRQQDDSADLAGMGDVPATLRAQLSARWQFAPGWRLGASINLDALNRGGGFTADTSLAREWRLGPGQTGTLSASVGGAGSRYMQTWLGVTPEQSARSGYAVYSPGAGLRDAQLSAVWRTEISKEWAGFAGYTYNRLLGAALDSPLSRERSGQALSAALVWRF
jgi:MipA family protein